MTHRARQGGDGGVAGDTITPPPRAVLGMLVLLLAVILFACGDPSDPDPTVGTLTGTVHDAETDVVIAGVALTISGREGVSGSDGAFAIDSVPVGTQPVTATKSGTLRSRLRRRSQAAPPRRCCWSWWPISLHPARAVYCYDRWHCAGTVTAGWSPWLAPPATPSTGARTLPRARSRARPWPMRPTHSSYTELSKGTTYYYSRRADRRRFDTSLG